jgi:formate hydrogenlyase transcriptional activator
MIAENQFRRDLFYRLNIFPLPLPPLRERREDIALLVEHFVEKYAGLMSRKISKVPHDVMQALREYYWPGNIRELQNVIERAVILSPGSVLRMSLTELQNHSNEAARPETLQEVEKQHILETLRQTKWVIGGASGAAIKLGMMRTSLVYKMGKLGITRPWK